jgi:hypothetical protein
MPASTRAGSWPPTSSAWPRRRAWRCPVSSAPTHKGRRWARTRRGLGTAMLSGVAKTTTCTHADAESTASSPFPCCATPSSPSPPSRIYVEALTALQATITAGPPGAGGTMTRRLSHSQDIRLSTAAGRVDLPRRAQRHPVLPGDLLEPGTGLRLSVMRAGRQCCGASSERRQTAGRHQRVARSASARAWSAGTVSAAGRLWPTRSRSSPPGTRT